MSPSTENLFDGLPDELLHNILERLLWRPDKRSAGKAQQRVRLEAVCRRFQKAVFTCRMLDWDLTGPANSETIFMRYVLSRAECMASLEKVAIQFWGEAYVMPFMLLVIPGARETLREVRVFCIQDEEVVWENVIFSMLPECRKLEVLEISLWDSPSTTPLTWLELIPPLAPFGRLSSLLLYGFSVPSASLAPFIQRYFPRLKRLELHTASEGLYSLRSTGLEKLFCWGRDIERFDTFNPAGAGVPRSLNMLLTAFETGDLDMQEAVLGNLNHLLASTSVCKPIIKVPGFVQRLVKMLGQGSAPTSMLVADVLVKLSVDSEARSVLGEVRGNLLPLVDFIINVRLRSFKDLRDRIAVMLVGLFVGGKTRELLASDSARVRRLVWFVLQKLETEAPMALKVMEILAHLTQDAKCFIPVPKGVWQVQAQHLNGVLLELNQIALPGLYEGILDALEHPAWREHGVHRGAVALSQLVAVVANRKRLADMPECLKRLVRLLNVGKVERQRWTGIIMQRLSEDAYVARQIAEVDGSLKRLVACLHVGGAYADDIKASATKVLANIASSDERHREMIAGLPEVTPMLVK